MISDNLSFLRKYHKMSQEEVAEYVGVSRQTIAKWEAGDSIPDLENSNCLAELYQVSLDDLVNYNQEEMQLPIPPKGRYTFGTVEIDKEGKIVIPKKARDAFKLKPGDKLLVLGDVKKGLALMKVHFFHEILQSIMKKEETEE